MNFVRVERVTQGRVACHPSRAPTSSRDGASRINITFLLSRNLDAAANDVRDSVSRVVARLPQDRPFEDQAAERHRRPSFPAAALSGSSTPQPAEAATTAPTMNQT